MSFQRKIAIDLDDVTVQTGQALTQYNNEVYGSNSVFGDHKDFDLSKAWKCSPEEAMRRVYEFYHSDRMDALEPIEGAITGIMNLHSRFELHFITSRPDFLQEKTQRWIGKHLPNAIIPVHFTNQFTMGGKSVKKSTICKQFSITLLIEDYSGNAYDCISEGITVLLFDRPWNQNLAEQDKLIRVKAWDEIVEKIDLYS